MVGSVNYGSGRRAYDPTQTVAGKTGTCIGQGGWVGLFTSYAPLANPRLAVVVIAQGSDARGHFPAAVAGEIYRELNHRFGTAINMQVATTLDDEEKEAADAEAAESGETSENTDAGDTNQAVSATATPSPTVPAATKPTTVENSTPRSTVKRVLMSIPKKPTEQTINNSSEPTPNPKVPAGSMPPAEQRPRRAHPDQP